MAKYSQAQNKASQKYIKNNYERIYISLPKGFKDQWKVAADERGVSLTTLIKDAVEAYLKS